MDVLNLHIHKLGHDLEEIRLRSLNNILNKLEMGLVTEEELIENPDFIKNIITWFTFPVVPKKDMVLKLILRISKIDRGKAFIARFDPNLKLIQDATKREFKEIFEELLLNCRSFVRSQSPTQNLSSSLELSVTSRRRNMNNVWILWRWLPEVDLAESDSRLISSLHSSLLNTEQFRHSAHFFSSILLRDFPPQVFLQRPLIINVFLDVIQSRRPEGAIASCCLEEFTYSLINEICMCRNTHVSQLFSSQRRVGSMELSISTRESSINTSRSPGGSSSSLEIYNKDKSIKKTESKDLMEYCVSVMESIVRSERYGEIGLIRSVLHLIQSITTDPNIPWHMSPVHKFSNIFAILAASAHRSQVLEPLDKLELNIVLWELLDKLVPIDVSDIALNKQMQEVLYQSVLDPVLSLIYPKIHQSFSAYLDRCKYTPSAVNKLLIRVGNSIRAGAEFLYSYESLSMKETVDLFLTALEGIEYHQNYSIIPSFLHTCVKRYTEVIDSIDENVTGAVLQLLSSYDSCIIKATLSELYQLVEMNFRPRELTRNTSINVQPLLPVLINHKILIEIISYSLPSRNKDLAVLSEDILVLIIKSKSLVSDKNWSLILAELIPTFPYLQVFGGRTTPLGKEILNLFDPDAAGRFQIQPLQVLLGNLRFLVHKESGTRDEAISRLMYLLHIPSKPLNLILPHDPIIPKKNLSDIYEPSSMVRVIDLLHEPGLESRVIKSALVQLSVMTEDILLHDLFIKHSGLEIVTSYLTSTDKDLYQEIFGPSLAILKNFVRVNGKLRHEYSLKADILKNAVRGLFLCDLDWRMQRDISQFLVLISYSAVIHTSVDNVSFPHVILERIRDPFSPASHAQSSQYGLPSYKDELLKDGRQRCLLSLQWALGSNKGNLEDLLRNSQLPQTKFHLYSSASSNETSTNSQPIANSFPALLPLPKAAIIDLAFCHPYGNIALALDKLATATSHKQAFESVATLKRYKLYLVLTKPLDMTGLPWEEAFTRYLATPPSSTTDQQLLLDIVKFFNMKCCNISVHAQWLSRLFQEPSPVLLYLLKQTACDECTSLKKELCMEMLNLLRICIKNIKEGWSLLFNLLIDALNDRHSLGFYCLGVMECLVGCIYEACKIGLRSPAVVPALYQLLPAFQPTTPTSYMGLRITSLTLTSLNLCLDHKKHQDYIKDWDLNSIVDRLTSRDVIVKASTLQLLSGLCYSASSTSHVVSSSNDLWATSLCFVVDHNEVNIVREQAALLCSNILYHQERKAYVEEAESRGLFRSLAIVISKLSTETVLSPKAIGLIQSSTQCLQSSNSTLSDEYENRSTYENEFLVTTLAFLEASCSLVINIVSMSNDVNEVLRTQGFSPALFRFLCQWCTKDANVYKPKIRLYTKICKLLSLCPMHAGKMINDSLCNIVWILQPSSLGAKDADKSIYENLWMEAINLLGSLLSTYPEARVHLTNESLKTIQNAVTSQNLELQSSSLNCIPAIAPSLNSKASEMLVEKLIILWNKSSVKESVRRDARFALSSLLANSHAGTKAALAQGLAESLVLKLRETYVTLNVLPPDVPRQKKCNAVLANLSVDVALLSNLLAGNQEAKELASSLGVADALHKLWNWCLLDFSLISSLLQALITFSASSLQGSISLVLTSTVVGVGQRKSPTSSSILHAALELLSMPVYSVEIKLKVLQLASHACQASECRVVISKSHILREFLKFNSEKKSNATMELELGWLNFFCVFTNFSEGANVLKDQGFFDFLINCLSGNRKDILKLSINIFRNLSFQSQSKQKLLMSDNLLTTLSIKLLDDSLSLDEEKRDIILLVWALSANSQKSKQILRNFGFLDRIQLLSALVPEYTPLSTIVDTTLSVLKS